MITKEEFVKILTNYQKFRKGVDRFFEALTGNKYYFECDWIEANDIMFETCIEAIFTEMGADWIFYYLYEDIKDKRLVVTIDADMFEGKKEIEYHLNSIEELWNFLITDKKTYFKNAE